MTARQIVPQAVPDRARQTAARLSALFEHDQRLCERLNDAGRRLAGAWEQLQGDVPGGDHRVAVTGTLIRRAFFEYRQACEERRQLAVDVGELSQQLSDQLGAVGFTKHDARQADVHALARGADPGREPGR
jgi:hypothetical protein